MLLVIKLLLLATQGYASTPCVSQLGSCEYYTCMDQEYSCEKSNYFKNYAKKYCDLFQKPEVIRKSSLATQAWYNEVRPCLMRAAEEMEYPLSGELNKKQCKAIRKKAYDDHSGCYIDAGFCNLNYKEQVKVYRLLRKELHRPALWREFVQITRECEGFAK